MSVNIEMRRDVPIESRESATIEGVSRQKLIENTCIYPIVYQALPDSHDPSFQTNIVESLSSFYAMKLTTIPDRLSKWDPFDWHVSTHNNIVSATPIPKE